MNTEPIEAELATVVHKAGGIDIQALISQGMADKATVEVIKELREMWLQDQARAAEHAYNEAMSSFQSACPIIKKSKEGAKNSYRYAPLDDIVAQVRGLIREHGFNYTITSEIEPGWIKAICKVTHHLGHAETSAFKVPIDSRNPMMNEPQRYAGSMTFAKRYAFCNAFGILTADEDRDGAGRPKPQGPSSIQPEDTNLKDLARELWEVLKTVRGTQKNWNEANQWLWREEILDAAVPEEAPNLTAEKFRKAISSAKELLSRQ